MKYTAPKLVHQYTTHTITILCSHTRIPCHFLLGQMCSSFLSILYMLKMVFHLMLLSCIWTAMHTCNLSPLHCYWINNIDGTYESHYGHGYGYGTMMNNVLVTLNLYLSNILQSLTNRFRCTCLLQLLSFWPVTFCQLW